MRQLLVAALMSAVVVACKPQVSTQQQYPSQGSSTQAESASKAPTNGEAMNQPTNTGSIQLLGVSKDAPEPGEVLYWTYMDKGDGSSAYKIQNDAFATFWFGVEYSIAGEHIYTGFSYATAQRFGEDAKHHEPQPDDKVTIGEASFVRQPEGAGKKWKFRGNNEYLGEAGSFDHLDPYAKDGKIILHAIDKEKFLIAVPTESLQSGSMLSYYVIFSRVPEQSRWTYLGQVYAGADNGAACGPDGTEPCAKSTGKLSFVDKGSDLPEIHVEMSGAEVSGPGKTRTLGAEDGRVYVFDAEKKSYNPTKS